MFSYDLAFSRNIGWVTADEQSVLKEKRIAIAGAGGVGGEHLITLLRMGVGHFNISDFDKFEVHNFNRQAGAFMSTLNEPKVSVMRRIALDINPEAKINTFETGTARDNVDEFLRGVDIYVDSLDFFALEARLLLFDECEKRKIPVITAAPLGYGSACLCFMPGSMSYRDYFGFDDKADETEQLLRFLVGLAPAFLHASYLVDRTRADFQQKKGPSTPMAVKMCASVAGTNAVKMLLNRGKVICAPKGIQFDAYKNKLKVTWRPLGAKNPLQRIAMHVARNTVLK